jgi:hypothetical protein
MAAVAAASAELLIIGWYIFRVLLQVSVPGLRVGDGSRCAHPKPASRLPPPVPHPIPIAAIPVYPSAATALRAPTRSLRPPPRADPSQCARARLGTKTLGRGGCPLRTSLRLLATQVVRKTRYIQTRPQEGGGALVCFETVQHT